MRPVVEPADKVVLDGDIKMHFSMDSGMFVHLALDGEASGTVNVDNSEKDYYEGPYIVIPTAYEQELETDQKYMADDVTVLEIPYTEVSNPSGGMTVSIG